MFFLISTKIVILILKDSIAPLVITAIDHLAPSVEQDPYKKLNLLIKHQEIQ
jgi:hypothetical protein